MRNILFYCNTYYQLIIAIQLKITLFKNDNVSLILSDHTESFKTIIKNLEEEKIFSEILFIKTKKIDFTSKNILKKLKHLYKTYFNKFSILKNYEQKQKYDAFFYFNQNISTNLIYSIISKNNLNLKCYQYEEGIFSYDAMKYSSILKINSLTLKLYLLLKKIVGNKTLVNETKNVFVFYPNLYSGDRFVNKIPLLELNGELTNILKNIFQINFNKYCYKQKYIYFSAICDVEGGEPIGELNLVQKIANLVGRNNLLIKEHPRDTRKIYSKYGLNVDKNSAIPWEVIQLIHDFKKHVFLTATSGSVLTINMILSERPKTYFLFNLCNINNNYIAKKVAGNLEKFLRNFSKHLLFKNVYIVNDLKEILK